MTTPSLPVLDPTAAAIDVGSEQLHVSIAGGRPKSLVQPPANCMNCGLSAGARGALGGDGSHRHLLALPYEVLEKAGLQVVVGQWKST